MSTSTGTNQATPSSANMDENMDASIPANIMNVKHPDLYSGDRNKLEDWLMQWDLFFLFQGEKIPENKRVTLIASYMRGQAFTWIKPFIQQTNMGEAPDAVDAWVSDFDLFKQQIRPVFGVQNEEAVARRKIQHIRQLRSAADYAAEFQQLAANTDWDDTALKTMFRQGLKPRVKEELMRTGAVIDSLDQLVNEAIRVDSELYELQQELRADLHARMDVRPPPRNPWRNNLSNRGSRGGRYQPNTGRRIHNNTQSGYYGPEAMDLSIINKGPDRWSKQSKQGRGSKPDKSKVTCYGCGKQGHYARDCRMKNKVVRQLNVLTTGDEGTGDEWEVLTDDLGCLEMDTESEEDLEEDHGVYGRPPTPYPEPDDAKYKAHDLSQKHRDIFTDSSRPSQRQVIGDTDGRYHAVCIRREEDQIIIGKRHHGDFIQYGDEYYTPDHQELRVIDRNPATLQQEQRMLSLLDQVDEVMDSYEETEDEDDKEEQDDFYDTEEQCHLRYARVRLEDDGQGLTGLNRQVANARYTDVEWDRVTRQRNQENNRATRAELDLYNRHAPSRSEPDWSYQPSPAITNENHLFWRDERNPKHNFLPWQQCYKGSCQIHYMKKVEHKWFPSKRGGCARIWYQCKNVKCEDHLWDKRTMAHFPGITDPQTILKMQLVVNGHCKNELWEECLNADCKRHLVVKEVYGFTKQQEPFLGQRRRSTWNDPSTTLGSIDSSNSPSC